MPAPIGNKYALNHGYGRVSKFDRKDEADALLEWALTEEALVLRMFAPLRGYTMECMQKWAQQDEDFLRIYTIAKELVGARRELKLINSNSPSPFQRYATWYDQALAIHEKDRESETTATKEDIEKLSDLIKSQPHLKD